MYLHQHHSSGGVTNTAGSCYSAVFATYASALRLYSARATLTRCFWPPLRLMPRSPISAPQHNTTQHSHGHATHTRMVS